jgi:hypothetical protein
MESTQTCQNAATKPTTVTPLGGVTRCMNFDLCSLSERSYEGKSHEPTWGNFLPNSLLRRSANPANRLPPPVRTTLPIKTWRSSGSQARSDSPIRPGMFWGRFGLDAYVKCGISFACWVAEAWHTTNCGEWKKNCSPTENRSGPKYALKPVGNSYCLAGLLAATLCNVR